MQNLTKTEIDKVRQIFAEKNDTITSIHNIFLKSLYMTRKLPKSFMVEFQDKLNWKDISYYQNLSDDFILKFLNKIDLSLLVKNIYFINKHHSDDIIALLLLNGYEL